MADTDWIDNRHLPGIGFQGGQQDGCLTDSLPVHVGILIGRRHYDDRPESLSGLDDLLDFPVERRSEILARGQQRMIESEC